MSKWQFLGATELSPCYRLIVFPRTQSCLPLLKPLLLICLVLAGQVVGAESDGTNFASLRLSHYLTDIRGSRFVAFVFSNRTSQPLNFGGYGKYSPVYSLENWTTNGWLRVTRYLCGTGLEVQRLEAGESITFREFLFQPVTQDWRIGISFSIREIDGDNSGGVVWSDAVQGPPPERADLRPIPDDPAVRFGGWPLSYWLKAGDDESAEAFWHLGAAAVPALVEVLRDSRYSAATHLRAVVAFGRIGPAGSNAIPALIEATKYREDDRVQAAAIRSLGLVGPNDPRACQVVAEKAVEPNSYYVSETALLRLGEFRSLASRHLPRLLDYKLSSLDDFRSYPFVSAMGKIGPDAREAAPTLRRLMNSKIGNRSNGDREGIAWALWRMTGSLEGLSVLRSSLTNWMGYSPELAAEYLSDFGLLAKEAEPELRSLIRFGQPRARVNAAGALYQVTGEAEPALTVLLSAATADDYHVPGYAAEQLGKFRVKKDVVRRQLNQLTTNYSPFVRLRAKQALQALGSSQ